MPIFCRKFCYKKRTHFPVIQNAKMKYYLSFFSNCKRFKNGFLNVKNRSKNDKKLQNDNLVFGTAASGR
jgi:hypothetical protein